jgi:hypothetical protein
MICCAERGREDASQQSARYVGGMVCGHIVRRLDKEADRLLEAQEALLGRQAYGLIGRFLG